MTFNEAERSYLAGQMLGHLATVGPDGTPQVRPLGFRLNPDDTIDLGGPRLTDTQRYRNVVANPRVGFVVDDMTPDEPGAIRPGMGRGVEIRGHAETLTVDDPPVNPEWFSHEIIRIHPRRIISWHIDPAQPDGQSRNVVLARAQEPVAGTPTPAQPTPSRALFEDAYTSRTAPWVIGEPQPAIVALERSGSIRGSVLDAGCGTGEHTIHLAGLGYDVRGIDSSEHAIEQARANAAARKVTARFEVADALALADDPIYDSVIDSALFHIFDPADRGRYVRSLHRACRPGAVVHILALSDTGPGFGPQVSDTVIRQAFGEGWALEDLRSSQYRGVIVDSTRAAALGRPVGDLVDLPAWLARARRI
jgi:PPOX class F420-dependent enzyme/OxyR family protein